MKKVCKHCPDCDFVGWFKESEYMAKCPNCDRRCIRFKGDEKEPPMPRTSSNPTQIYQCLFCNEDIKSKVPNRRFCSIECRKNLEIKQSNEKWVERDLDKRPKFKFGELQKVPGWRRVL